MTDPLRERLATWFKAVHHRHEHGVGDYCEACAGKVPADKSAEDMVWFVMANEVVRCMEWARRGSGSVWFEGVRHDNVPLVIESPLTLPPEDWKP